jgi:hypothetical protein
MAQQSRLRRTNGSPTRCRVVTVSPVHRWLTLGACVPLLAGCGGGSADAPAPGGDGGIDAATVHDAAPEGSRADSAVPGSDGGSSPEPDAGDDAEGDAGTPITTCAGDDDSGAGCYAITCNSGGVHTLQANRDRLVADLAKRKCTDSCTLWAALNQAERYVFLMDTTYFGDTTSRLYPPSYANLETALDHAVALYSINGPLARAPTAAGEAATTTTASTSASTTSRSA